MKQVQILNKTVDISHNTNTPMKRHESNYSPFKYELIVGQTGFFNLGMTTTRGEVNL